MLRLAMIVELLPQPFGQLLEDALGAHRPVAAFIDGEHQAQLPEVGLDGRRHVRILQLAGKARAVRRGRAVDLAERRRMGRAALEIPEALPPSLPQLARHAPAHERPAHGRRIGLQLPQFLGIGRRQRVRNGGEDLRDLHQRPLEAADRSRQFARMGVMLDLAP